MPYQSVEIDGIEYFVSLVTDDKVSRSLILSRKNGTLIEIPIPDDPYRSLVMLPQQMFSGNVVYDVNGNEESADIRWPDGMTGVYTLLATDSVSLEPASWSCTKDLKTFTQPTMTFDEDGNPLTRPAIVMT